MKVVWCPQCKLPLINEESSSGLCPTCGVILPEVVPAEPAVPDEPPSAETPRHSFVGLLWGGVGLLLLLVGGWFLVLRLSSPVNSQDPSDPPDNELAQQGEKPDAPLSPPQPSKEQEDPLKSKEIKAKPEDGTATRSGKETPAEPVVPRQPPEGEVKKPAPLPAAPKPVEPAPPVRMVGADVKKPLTLADHPGGVASLVFSLDGRQVAVGTREGRVKVWDMPAGVERVELKGPAAQVLALSFSPDGKMLAAAAADRSLLLWELATPAAPVWQGQASVLHAIQISPDGKSLLGACWDRSVKRWDTATGAMQTVLGRRDPNSTGGLIAAIAFSADSGKLAWASKEGTATVWDLADERQLCRLVGHENAVVAAAFHPDGRQLATGSRDGTAKLWDVATGQLLGTFPGRKGYVNCLAFSPDGRTLATGGQDGTVKLWDLATGTESASFQDQVQGVTAVRYSPTGKTLAVGTKVGTVELLPLPSED